MGTARHKWADFRPKTGFQLYYVVAGAVILVNRYSIA